MVGRWWWIWRRRRVGRMVGKWRRIIRHLLTPDWLARRHFPGEVLDRIEAAIVDSESRHRGEIRFAVESEIELSELLKDVSPHQRAIEAFGHLGVWDTEENSGVLVFVQLVDRRVLDGHALGPALHGHRARVVVDFVVRGHGSLAW